MNEFEINNMIFKISDTENHEVELKSTVGILGEFRGYGNRDNRIKEKFEQKIFKLPQTVLSPKDNLIYTVTSIGKGLFDCMEDVETIILPGTLKKIEWGFWQCKRLKSIKISECEATPASPSSPGDFCSINGVLFNLTRKKLIAFPNMNCNEYTIPNGVEEISKFAFKDCNNIMILHFPVTIKKIGVNAFYRCNNLKRIYTKVNPLVITNEGCTGSFGNVNPEWFVEK